MKVAACSRVQPNVARLSSSCGQPYDVLKISLKLCLFMTVIAPESSSNEILSALTPNKFSSLVLSCFFQRPE